MSDDRRALLETQGGTVTAIQLLSITKPTAGKAIEVLTRAAILTEVGARKRHRLYRYDKYLQLLA